MSYEYEGGPWIQYERGVTFVRVCVKCGRYVKADEIIQENDEVGLIDQPNATCKKCGRTKMVFEGFF